MIFGRTPAQKATIILHAAALLLLTVAAVQFLRFYVIDDFTHPGSFHDLDSIAVIITHVGADWRAGVLPASHFTCVESVHCAGQVNGHALIIDAAFDTTSGHTCSGIYNSQPIACTTTFNSDDYAMALIHIDKGQLGLTSAEAARLQTLGRIAPYQIMLQLWMILGVLYVLVALWRIADYFNPPATSALHTSI